MVQTLVRGINPGQVHYKLGGSSCDLGMQGASPVLPCPCESEASPSWAALCPSMTYVSAWLSPRWAGGWVVALTLLVRKPSADV